MFRDYEKIKNKCFYLPLVAFFFFSFFAISRKGAFVGHHFFPFFKYNTRYENGYKKLYLDEMRYNLYLNEKDHFKSRQALKIKIKFKFFRGTCS